MVTRVLTHEQRILTPHQATRDQKDQSRCNLYLPRFKDACEVKFIEVVILSHYYPTWAQLTQLSLQAILDLVDVWSKFVLLV